MVRIFKINDLEDRRRVLTVQSDVYRETLKLQIATIQLSVDHLKSRLGNLDMSSLAFKTVADLAGLFIHQAQPDGKPGFLAKVVSGIRFFNQVRDFFRRVKPPSAN